MLFSYLVLVLEIDPATPPILLMDALYYIYTYDYIYIHINAGLSEAELYLISRLARELPVQFNALIFRIARLLRILQLEDFVESFTLLDDAWRSCRETMVATGCRPEKPEKSHRDHVVVGFRWFEVHGFAGLGLWSGTLLWIRAGLYNVKGPWTLSCKAFQQILSSSFPQWKLSCCLFQDNPAMEGAFKVACRGQILSSPWSTDKTWPAMAGLTVRICHQACKSLSLPRALWAPAKLVVGTLWHLASLRYFTIIFLGGEWAKIDFTPGRVFLDFWFVKLWSFSSSSAGGKIVCVIYCVWSLENRTRRQG